MTLYIEIKTRYLDAGDANKIINTKTVIAVVCTGKISKPAKKLFDEAGITWAENVKKSDFPSYQAKE
jgi:chaperonin GroEL (HSP60 family)